MSFLLNLVFQGTNGIWFWQIILYWYIFWQLCKDLARWYLDIFIYILLLNFKFLQETNCNIWIFLNTQVEYQFNSLLHLPRIALLQHPSHGWAILLISPYFISLIYHKHFTANVVCLNKEVLMKEILLWLYQFVWYKKFPTNMMIKLLANQSY